MKRLMDRPKGPLLRTPLSKNVAQIVALTPFPSYINICICILDIDRFDKFLSDLGDWASEMLEMIE